MKILVIGGTGRVGSEVVQELRKRDADIRILVRKKDASATGMKGAETAVGDLLDPVSMQRRSLGWTSSTCSTPWCQTNLPKP